MWTSLRGVGGVGINLHARGAYACRRKPQQAVHVDRTYRHFWVISVTERTKNAALAPVAAVFFFSNSSAASVSGARSDLEPAGLVGSAALLRLNVTRRYGSHGMVNTETFRLLVSEVVNRDWVGEIVESYDAVVRQLARVS